MSKPIARDPIYRRRVFDAEIIELCVRWYITYRLSFPIVLPGRTCTRTLRLLDSGRRHTIHGSLAAAH